MSKRKLFSIAITEPTRERLIARMKWGDSYEKALIELLDLADKVEGKPQENKE